MSQLHAEGMRYLPLKGNAPIANLAIAYRPKASSNALGFTIEWTRESARESPYAAGGKT